MKVRWLGLAALLFASCGATRTTELRPLGFEVPDLAAEVTPDQAREATDRLERVWVEEHDARDPHGRRRRLWATVLTAELHARAAREPWLTEPVLGGQQPSANAHRVVATETARVALAQLGRVRDERIPAEVAHLAPLGLAGVAQSLEVLLAVTHAELGFESELERLFATRPALRDPETAPAVLRQLQVPAQRIVALCRSASQMLRGSDERDAFRFAILAIEGPERFGAGPTDAEVRELEGWILRDARARFVCPRSQTEYVSGQTKSPVSGVAHFDYVAVER